MAYSKYESIWQLLSTNDFKEEILQEYHCIICKNVAIEPFIALCECRFCCKCIKEYLKDGRKHCPGIKNDCKEYLEIEVNVSRDIKAVRSIGRIIVKCPNEMCEVSCNLENMSDHLRVCGMSKTKCPYENIGCELRQISKDNIKIHYDDEWFTHSQLVVEAIDNLRNDFDQLRKVVERRDEEINKLNEDSAIKETTIKKIERQIEDQRNVIDTLQYTIEKKDEEIEEMKEEFRIKIETQKTTIMKEFYNVKNDMNTHDLDIKVKINEVRLQIYDQKSEINELKVQRDREMEVMIETQKKMMMEELKNIKKDIVEISVRRDLEDQIKSLDDLKVNQENIERQISSAIMKVRDSQIYDEREFIWRVFNFSKMRDNYKEERRVILWRYSLKLCLTLWCYGDYFGFYCRILKGEFDDILNWPMKYKIMLSIMNQDTMKIHKGKVYHFELTGGNESAFEKPTNEWNKYSFGDSDFMIVKDIIDSPGLLLNDSLIVSFNIDY